MRGENFFLDANGNNWENRKDFKISRRKVKTTLKDLFIRLVKILCKGVLSVIKLTRFNSESNKKGEFILNAEVIQLIEETPDTVITLMNEKKIIVDEPADEVVRRVMKYRRALRM